VRLTVRSAPCRGLIVGTGHATAGGVRTFADSPLHEVFRRFARRSAEVLGLAETFLVALALIVGWAVLGPRFGFSDTWQLVINTGTTIITFLMVFVIQNTQNREAKAIQLKLDELLRGVRGARTEMVKVEQMTDSELEALVKDFEKLHTRVAKAREALEIRQAKSSRSGATP
jgi:low affinity Fe/Cu permease